MRVLIVLIGISNISSRVKLREASRIHVIVAWYEMAN